MGNKASHHSHPIVEELDNSTSYAQEATVELLQCKQIVKAPVIKNEKMTIHSVLGNTRYTENEIIEILNIFIYEGMDLNVKNINEETVLHLAVSKRYKNVIDFLLKNNANINVTDRDGNSIAHIFIINEVERFTEIANMFIRDSEDHNKKTRLEIENTEFIKWMLSRGFDFDCQNRSGQSALHWAIENNLQHILPVLLKNTKNINFVSGNEKQTLLILLDASNGTKNPEYLIKYLMSKNTKQNQEPDIVTIYKIQTNDFSRRYVLEIVKIMLERGVYIADEDGLRALDLTMHVYPEERMDVVKVLLDRLMEGNNGYKVIHKIVEKATLESSNTGYYSKVLRVLLDKGIDVNIEDENGLTSVYYPVKRRCSRVIKLMKEKGTDFSFITSKGQNAIFWLFSDFPRNTVNDSLQEILFLLLLKEGCSVNLVDNFGQTPLHLASQAGRIFIVRQILGFGVDVNCQDIREKKTALHLAVEKGFFEVAELLINRGAEIDCKDSSGSTALNLAVKGEYVELINLLLNHGANVNSRDNQGDRPVHIAAAMRNRNILQMLLKRGALVNARNNNGESPFVRVMEYKDNRKCDLESIENCFHDLLIHGAGINNDSDPSWLLQNWMFYCKSMLRVGIQSGIKGRFRSEHSEEESYNLYFKYYEKYYPEWVEEIDKLKTSMIDRRTSIYDWLHQNSNRQCIYIHNQKLLDIIHSPTLEKQYQRYSTVILGTYQKCKTRKLLIEQARDAWNKFTNIYLPEICMENIFSYLNNGDLIDVMDVTNCDV